jgi:hypothetical protein
MSALSGHTPYQKVNLVAHQHIPRRDLNTARAVCFVVPSADTGVGAHVVPARVQKERPGEGVATVATFIGGPTAGVLSLQQFGAWQSVRAARARRAGGATGVQAARRSYR